MWLKISNGWVWCVLSGAGEMRLTDIFVSHEAFDHLYPLFREAGMVAKYGWGDREEAP